jgi:TPR repeat protein
LLLVWQRGAGIEKDEAKAAELFKRAADEGNLPSLEQIGLYFNVTFSVCAVV